MERSIRLSPGARPTAHTLITECHPSCNLKTTFGTCEPFNCRAKWKTIADRFKNLSDVPKKKGIVQVSSCVSYRFAFVSFELSAAL
jgi:hypothetical protein